MVMKILCLEDSDKACDNIELFNDRHNYQIDFVDTITAFDEIIFYMEGYKTYDAFVIDLCINMPQLTREFIVERIPLLNLPEVPTYCVEGENIPLYGLDYFRLVIAKRAETEAMVSEGRVIFFSGHAAKIRTRGDYDESMPVFKHTTLIDRAEQGATSKLFSMLSEIEGNMKKRGGNA